MSKNNMMRNMLKFNKNFLIFTFIFIGILVWFVNQSIFQEKLSEPKAENKKASIDKIKESK